ncbi:MAG: V-type ATPase 116kDa subunit family protein, partial [Methanosarcinaceae archaeon]|nr:V-type ATPase 116kDa subunit family protein [Methanosarcinaceae archaeon]
MNSVIHEIARSGACHLADMKEMASIHPVLSSMTSSFPKLKDKLWETEYTYIFEMWIPADKAKYIVLLIEKAAEHKCAVSIIDPIFEGTPPTLLKNPPVMKPFENLVRVYGLPSYYEFDPTAIMFVTFPLLFGMMYGDLGHGLLLLLLSSLWMFATNIKGKKIFRQYQALAVIVLISSFYSIMFGLFYGEFFGMEIPALWHNPIKNMLNFVKMVLIVAVAHTSLGLSLHFFNLWRNKKYTRSFLQMIWVLFYIGGTSFIILYLFIQQPDLFTQNVKNAFLVLCVIPGCALAVGQALVSIVEEGHLVQAIASLFELLLEYTMHLLSYARIVGMAAAHIVISKVILSITGSGMSSFLLAVVVSFILIIVVETFICSLQTLRLHWVEWFYIFYEGKGVEFEPL